METGTLRCVAICDINNAPRLPSKSSEIGVTAGPPGGFAHGLDGLHEGLTSIDVNPRPAICQHL